MHPELGFEPTFTMTTQSHMREGNRNRYRLFYFFNRTLIVYDGFKRTAELLVSDPRRVLTCHGDGDTAIDDISADSSRFFYGNPCDNLDTITSWCVYDPTEINPKYVNQPTVWPADDEAADKKERPVKEEQVKRPAKWTLLQEWCKNPKKDFADIAHFFHPFYHISFKTPMDYPDNGKAFVLPPENYMYLRFQWRNGGKGRKGEIIRWHDGEHRRRKFSIQLKLIAYMNNFELTIDQLVFHAIYLFSVAYCNTTKDGKTCSGDNFITPKMVMDKAREVYQLCDDDMEDIVSRELEIDKCTYLVNRLEAMKQGKSVRMMLGEARKQYHSHLWEPRLEILKPYVELGYTNSQLAKILKQETGESFSKDTIGLRVAPLREYRADVEEGVADSTALSMGVRGAARAASVEIDDRGANLMKHRQNGVSKRNQARFEDMEHRKRLFTMLYNSELSDKENYRRIRELLNISNGTYYKYKRGLLASA